MAITESSRFLKGWQFIWIVWILVLLVHCAIPILFGHFLYRSNEHEFLLFYSNCIVYVQNFSSIFIIGGIRENVPTTCFLTSPQLCAHALSCVSPRSVMIRSWGQYPITVIVPSRHVLTTDMAMKVFFRCLSLFFNHFKSLIRRKGKNCTLLSWDASIISCEKSQIEETSAW